jgi:AcrR family transcriptional regulator
MATRKHNGSLKRSTTRRRPGRPDKETFAREKILNAAERVFAHRGYARASFGEIVKRAKVTQALVNYYFGSKEGLFKEVYLRRAKELARARIEALEALGRRGKSLDVTDVLSAFLNPAFAIRRTPGGRAFLRMQWRLLHSEPPGFARSLHHEAYDATARRYVSVICSLVPGLSKATAYWRLVFIVGIFSFINSDVHRLEEISDGLCDANDAEEMLAQAKAFISAGMLVPDSRFRQARRPALPKLISSATDHVARTAQS